MSIDLLADGIAAATLTFYTLFFALLAYVIWRDWPKPPKEDDNDDGGPTIRVEPLPTGGGGIKLPEPYVAAARQLMISRKRELTY